MKPKNGYYAIWTNLDPSCGLYSEVCFPNNWPAKPHSNTPKCTFQHAWAVAIVIPKPCDKPPEPICDEYGYTDEGFR